MKSGGQIDGQMSSQSPVIWWCPFIVIRVMSLLGRGGIYLYLKIHN
jgi:hypothetical protein